MLTSRRDYLLRLVDEVSRLLARVILQRRAGSSDEALSTLVQACERLFGLEADKLFQFTPDQHRLMLIEDAEPEIARDKLLLYASLNAEAGRIYTRFGVRTMARASFLNALRFTLEARLGFPAGNPPSYAPDPAALRAELLPEPLDAVTVELLRRAGFDPDPGGPPDTPAS
jgi:hypothetical protein